MHSIKIMGFQWNRVGLVKINSNFLNKSNLIEAMFQLPSCQNKP